MKSSIFEKVLNTISLDPRIEDGTFQIEKNVHMEVLREYFTGKGIKESVVIEFCNKVLEGKYPERQAYNAKGILVTFPTPEYKAQAIKRGTHFEKDPTKQASNIFQDEPTDSAPVAVPTPSTAPKQPSTDTKTSLPISQAAPPGTEPTAPAAPSAPAPSTTSAAPQQTTEPEEPPIEPTKLPPPIPKSPSEKEADKTAIKNMLKGDDYMLEQMIEWVVYNGPEYLVEKFRPRT